MSKAELVISPSRFLGTIFENEFSDLEIKTVSHGLRYTTLSRNEKRYMKGDRVVFCYAGSLNHHKGVHTLIDAFKKAIATERVQKWAKDNYYLLSGKTGAESKTVFSALE